MAVLAAAVACDPRIIVDLAALEFIDCCAPSGLIDVFSVHASVEDAVRIARPVVTSGNQHQLQARR